ncbi:hypothetical protein PCL_10235 [Purpureocillium lilacinum]|uniref:Uncharacterized protein n=1 Tax=Purpureocillium lilacinum TaxID=33203 RepID=A0A2U3EFK0_PURLI|nr:hypothetical protein PCL_10235 [Purpureocillium lilacinum]
MLKGHRQSPSPQRQLQAPLHNDSYLLELRYNSRTVSLYKSFLPRSAASGKPSSEFVTQRRTLLMVSMRATAFHVLIAWLVVQAAALGLQEKRFRSLEKRGALSQLGQLLGLDNLEIIGGGNNNNNGGGGNGNGNRGGNSGGRNGGGGGGNNQGGNGGGNNQGGNGGGNNRGGNGGGGNNNRGGGNNGGGNGGAAPATVTRTIVQTVTVDRAVPGGGGNGTSAPPNPVLGAPATKPGFEGLRLTTITQTVQGNGTGPTVTRTVQGNGQASTVTITELASTVTQTVTAPCASQPAAPQQPGGQNPPAQQPPNENPQRNRNSATAVIPATPNADGNGVGVSTVPIPESEKPTTTFGAGGPPAQSSAVNQGGEAASSSQAAAPSSQEAAPIAPSPSSSTTLVLPTPSPAAPAETPSSAGVGSGSDKSASTSSTSAGTSTSASASSSAARLAPSITLGGLPADASAPLESAITTPNAGVVAPAQPLTISGLSLSSQLDLGPLAQGAPSATSAR